MAGKRESEDLLVPELELEEAPDADLPENSSEPEFRGSCCPAGCNLSIQEDRLNDSSLFGAKQERDVMYVDIICADS